MRVIVTLKEHDQFAKIRFPYNPQMNNKIKTLVGWSFVGKDKSWKALACAENILKLSEWGCSLDNACQKIIAPKSPLSKTSGNNLIIPGLKIIPGKRELYPYQKDGIAFIESTNGRCLLGDEPRLGKTIQALAWLQLRNKDALPALVACPNSAKLVWHKMALEWTPIRTQHVNGRALADIWADLVIINYDILADAQLCVSCGGKGKNRGGFKCRACKGTGKTAKLRQDLAEVPWKTVILDEAHRGSDRTSQRTRSIHNLIRKTPFFIPISGTPLKKKPINFFNILNHLDRKEFGDWLKYVYEFCDAKSNGFGLNTNGSSNTEKLYEKVQNLMIRRHKRDVLPDLPEKSILVIPMEINNLAEYKKADKDFTEWIKEKFGTEKADKTRKAEALIKVGHLQRLASEGKFSHAVQWIEDLLESVDKVVIFAVHIATVDKLCKVLKKYNPVHLYGADSPKAREIAKETFQTDPKCKVFVGNILAAGESIELSAASDFVFMELYWDASVHEQAGERGLSPNQKSKEYNIWYLIADSTVESEIIEALDNEQRVIDAVLDGKETPDSSLISVILKKRLGFS